jgi:hypothetical protein
MLCGVSWCIEYTPIPVVLHWLAVYVEDSENFVIKVHLWTYVGLMLANKMIVNPQQNRYTGFRVCKSVHRHTFK